MKKTYETLTLVLVQTATDVVTASVWGENAYKDVEDIYGLTIG